MNSTLLHCLFEFRLEKITLNNDNVKNNYIYLHRMISYI